MTEVRDFYLNEFTWIIVDGGNNEYIECRSKTGQINVEL